MSLSPRAIVSNVDIYAYWDGQFGSHGTLWDWAASGDKGDITTVDGYPDDPAALEGDYPFQSVGPYDFAVGDSIRIVHVLGSNGISSKDHSHTHKLQSIVIVLE